LFQNLHITHSHFIKAAHFIVSLVYPSPFSFSVEFFSLFFGLIFARLGNHQWKLFAEKEVTVPVRTIHYPHHRLCK
jgi:hypothetical protein